jgi:hypothetical protein
MLIQFMKDLIIMEFINYSFQHFGHSGKTKTIRGIILTLWTLSQLRINKSIIIHSIIIKSFMNCINMIIRVTICCKSCNHKLSNYVVLFPHELYRVDFSIGFFSAKLWSQMAHLCGFFPSWTKLIWNFKWEFVTQLYSQIEHLCGFILSWTALICAFNWSFLAQL